MVDSSQSGNCANATSNWCAFSALWRLGRSRAALTVQHGLLSAILFIALYIGVADAVANPANGQQGERTVAVGPFFSPEGNAGLRQISTSMPDLLTVELSHQDGLHVVEREQVTAIWKELNLSTTGLVTPESVAHLGHILACDWLITGTLVPSNTRTQVWVKVIDVKSGVVLELQDLPFDAGNLSATIQGIADFVSKARSHRQADRFVTLGRFTDLSTDTSHEDWSRRIRTLIEQHCRDAHMGLVEREAIAPIFEEFQFERAGLTGAVTNRMRLQAAFWIVDGACKWVHDTEDNVTVTLRLQKIGGREQIIELTKKPGPELESAVLAALQPVLAASDETTSDKLGLDESTLHGDRGVEAANANDRFSRLHNIPTQYDTHGRPSPEHARDLQENRQSALESFEKALLLNPKDVRAKYMLGYALMGDHDPAQRERGKEFLKEVAALNVPSYSKQAVFYLQHSEMFDQKPLEVDARTAHHMSEAELAESQKRAIEAFEKQFKSNPTSVQAKFGFASALLGSHDEARRNQGKQLLREIVASNDPVNSKSAALILKFEENGFKVDRPAPKLSGPAAVKMAMVESEKPFRLNPTNAKAKYDYGYALLQSNNEVEKDRGKELLKQVAAANDPTYSKLAAMRLDRDTLLTSEQQAEFLQRNFSKLVPVKFEAATDATAKVQILHVKENLFEYKGRYYCGFQFTAPEWLDGDLQWMYLLAKTETNKDLIIERMAWYLAPQSGTIRGTHHAGRDAVPAYRNLRKRFPFSYNLNVIDTDKQRLEAGKSNALWFEFDDQNVCDIAFAMTIASQRGEKEFGMLPLR